MLPLPPGTGSPIEFAVSVEMRQATESEEKK
jgi:hypothetical protein